MSILEKVNNLCSKIMGEIQKKDERIQRYTERYENYDDETLMSKYNNRSFLTTEEELTAIRNILQSRGYSGH